LLQDSYGINGFHGGGTIGFNYQAGPVVLGVEADLSAADISGNGNCSDSFGLTVGALVVGVPLQGGCHTRLNSFGTVAGRLGLTSGRTMVFVKAGGAWGSFDREVITGVTFIGAGGPVLASASPSDTRGGFVLGTGVEHSLWRGWSAKFEYDFMDFGTENDTFRFTGPLITAVGGPGAALNLRADDREQVHVVRFGLNYRFGGDPGLAPLK
jgi:outer membrane immunogenic protein